MIHGVSSLICSKLPPRVGSSRGSAVQIVMADLNSRLQELSEFLGSQSGLDVAAQASTAAELLECSETLDPDVLVVDMTGPGADHIRPVLRRMHTRAHVMALVASADAAEFGRAMRLGCAGVALKDTAAELIAEGIRHLSEGRIWMDSGIAKTLAREFAHPAQSASRIGAKLQDGAVPLSDRERQLMRLVVQGYRNVGIAETLRISEQTVKNHLHSIFTKLGVSDRLELALYAIHNGFGIEDDPRPACYEN